MKNKPHYLYWLEIIHIPLWLIKDLCWLFVWDVLGVIMAIPTILVALIMVIISTDDRSKLFPNLSILFWIIANSTWMIAEFYDLNFKHFAAIPFGLGLLSFFVFLLIAKPTLKQTKNP
jgi:hypothetical protein